MNICHDMKFYLTKNEHKILNNTEILDSQYPSLYSQTSISVFLISKYNINNNFCLCHIMI